MFFKKPEKYLLEGPKMGLSVSYRSSFAGHLKPLRNKMEISTKDDGSPKRIRRV
jgi:hypothetical protein